MRVQSIARATSLYAGEDSVQTMMELDGASAASSEAADPF